MKYKIIEKNKVLVVSLDGNIGREDKDLLASCTKEVLEKEASSVVLYFQNVTNIDQLVFRDITLLQHEVRKKNLFLKVVGLSLAMKVLLNDRGVIRSSETYNDIKEVLTSLLKTA